MSFLKKKARHFFFHFATIKVNDLNKGRQVVNLLVAGGEGEKKSKFDKIAGFEVIIQYTEKLLPVFDVSMWRHLFHFRYLSIYLSIDRYFCSLLLFSFIFSPSFFFERGREISVYWNLDKSDIVF